MAIGETTNPGIPRFETMPVVEPRCQDRRQRLTDSFEKQTGEILAVQKETLTAVHDLKDEIVELKVAHKQHVAWHKGGEDAQKKGWKSAAYWIGLISLGITVASLLVLLAVKLVV